MTTYATQALEQETMARSKPLVGEHVKGKGVYIGTRELSDNNHQTIGLFNLYAAPQDMKGPPNLNPLKGTWLKKPQLYIAFNDAAEKVSRLKNHHGYNGFNHIVPGKKADDALYDALREDTYDGEWFIPPEELLADELYLAKYLGNLSDTLNYSCERKTNHYLSCSEEKYNATTPDSPMPHELSSIWGVSLSHGHGYLASKSNDTMNVRLMRAERIVRTSKLYP